ncbi:hypothetical protein Kpol_355p1 [Vanderwaltozyma polyspora DSM 70294]|uniref:Flo11 domain-containing protein n=1 Tax=Vanderwaltozyma polyspora (strain ATCC 22028 / DSM 70294 / BCRC 21397 / CBS 2163 / NBRC 10782 / NRRL Y-8283 / UCD 57-17) TaxID=436907 RepID=A7TS26_VANPO|nr:uncharacterized protein Kpol_355p1 [Vanderwaltozyma polyspora DSM 70294]EDO14930.1 hypothetical protein Kpol_355p1 [Vanderwaltozyma polyspora DSM 70294]
MNKIQLNFIKVFVFLTCFVFSEVQAHFNKCTPTLPVGCVYDGWHHIVRCSTTIPLCKPTTSKNTVEKGYWTNTCNKWVYKSQLSVYYTQTECVTSLPTSELPTSLLTSEIPTSEIPTSEIPTSEIPTSEIPTSEIPTSTIVEIEESTSSSESTIFSTSTTYWTGSYDTTFLTITEETTGTDNVVTSTLIYIVQTPIRAVTSTTSQYWSATVFSTSISTYTYTGTDNFETTETIYQVYLPIFVTTITITTDFPDERFGNDPDLIYPTFSSTVLRVVPSDSAPYFLYVVYVAESECVKSCDAVKS